MFKCAKRYRIGDFQASPILSNKKRSLKNRVMIRITKMGNGFAAADVFSQNIKKDTMQEMDAN